MDYDKEWFQKRGLIYKDTRYNWYLKHKVKRIKRKNSTIGESVKYKYDYCPYMSFNKAKKEGLLYIISHNYDMKYLDLMIKEYKHVQVYSDHGYIASYLGSKEYKILFK